MFRVDNRGSDGIGCFEIKIGADTCVFMWLGGLLVERRTSVSPIRGSIPRQVAAV